MRATGDCGGEGRGQGEMRGRSRKTGGGMGAPGQVILGYDLVQLHRIRHGSLVEHGQLARLCQTLLPPFEHLKAKGDGGVQDSERGAEQRGEAAAAKGKEGRGDDVTGADRHFFVRVGGEGGGHQNLERGESLVRRARRDIRAQEVHRRPPLGNLEGRRPHPGRGGGGAEFAAPKAHPTSKSDSAHSPSLDTVPLAVGHTK